MGKSRMSRERKKDGRRKWRAELESERERGFISSFRDKSAARHKVISHNGSSENWTATPVADCMGKYLAREKRKKGSESG